MSRREPPDKSEYPTVFDSWVYSEAIEELTARDRSLDVIVRQYGPPPLWRRDPGFATLVHIILEQQVSLASARSTYDKLLGSVRSLTPRSFLSLDDERLKQIGFSRQKIAYVRNLAESIRQGTLAIQSLGAMTESEARAALVALKGIGTWTADIYMLMVLGHPDVWPVGDLAIRVALRELHKLHEAPSVSETGRLAKRWRPWRSVAARILWHYYLSELRPRK